jgi:hypothetical protein
MYRQRLEVHHLFQQVNQAEARPVEAGLYTLAEAATRLACSRDFLRRHAEAYQVRRLEPGPRAHLYFPVKFIEDVIAGEAEPDEQPLKRQPPRRRRATPRAGLLPIKGQRDGR